MKEIIDDVATKIEDEWGLGGVWGGTIYEDFFLKLLERTEAQIAKRKIAEWVTAFIEQSDVEIPTYKLTMWNFID